MSTAGSLVHVVPNIGITEQGDGIDLERQSLALVLTPWLGHGDGLGVPVLRHRTTNWSHRKPTIEETGPRERQGQQDQQASTKKNDTDNDNDQFEQEYEEKGELDRPVIKIDTPAKNEDSHDDCALSNISCNYVLSEP